MQLDEGIVGGDAPNDDIDPFRDFSISAKQIGDFFIQAWAWKASRRKGFTGKYDFVGMEGIAVERLIGKHEIEEAV